jgi:HAD superfamily hydrolase (TIGR01509 family)
MQNGLVFDCDGTLVDSEGHYATVDSLVLARYGVIISADEIRTRYMGIGYAQMMADIATRNNTVFPDNMLEQLDVEVDAYLAEHLQAVRHIEPALETLSAQGWPMAVATNSRFNRTTRNLSITKLDRFFDNKIAAIDCVQNPKPAPDVYLAAAKMLRIYPRHCIAVEDSVVGTGAAVAADMVTVGYAPLDHDPAMAAKLSAAGAHVVIHDMADLVNAIEAAQGLCELI